MNKKRVLFLYVFAQLAILKQASAQQSYNPSKLFSIESLQEDFTVLRKILETAHIGLYRYMTKTSADSLFGAQYSQLNRPMTELEFLRIVNPVMTAIRDEHTFVLPSTGYWDSQIGQTVYSGNSSQSKAKLFPFFVKIIDQQIYIDNNLCSDATIPDGTEIVSVNGKTSKELLATLLPTVHTNGFVETFRYRNLEQFSLTQTYNRFMVNYALYIGSPDNFQLTIQRPGKNTKEEITVNALNSREIYNYYWRRYSSINDLKKRKEDPVEFRQLGDNIAYLRLSDFHDGVWRKYNHSFSTEYRNDFAFLKEKNIQNLVIDLRDNEGGNLGIGMDMLKYICTKPYRPYEYHEVINYRFPEFRNYVRDTAALPNLPDSVFIKTPQNTFRSNTQIASESWSRPMQPVSEPYQGKLYVLINGATGSAASIFATLIRVNRPDAIFIGEESGGDMQGPVSGSGLDIVLPNTRLRADIPYIRRFVNLNGYMYKKGRGIIPDHVLTPTVNDLINKIDTELVFTVSMINRK